MNDQQQDKNSPHLMQSLIMIFLETSLTFVLKNDRLSRIHAKDFFEHKVSLQFNVYLPSGQFYVSFDQRGVLFDLEKPEGMTQADIVITASTIDLIKILFTGNKKSIRRLQLKGHDELHKDFRLLLGSISLSAVISDWRYWLSSANTQTKPSRYSIQNLTQHIELQRQEITKLQIKVKSYRYDLKRLQRKHKMMTYLYWTIILALIISLISVICYNLNQ
ncbi:hypothetical protein F4V57_01245 [Acinetobacter qingfengensis]|uniref:SCP2 domain-containing protein n=1 Tax=Acinetobacter qingfengensis TaxID=1262585 RepID=A0A1E7R960_9GAMM|nr:hypothetical protein [Acinetobacter qingfengensis]KAA8735455.1 hypothetical protein F4V57_01245 [Acinetobacter qingfengensis]OEY95900.1 hypothetical protein BJI46_03005 [Acinetobacter qingfengensis]